MASTERIEALTRRRDGLALLKGIDPDIDAAVTDANEELARLKSPKAKRALTWKEYQFEMDALAQALAKIIHELQDRLAALEAEPRGVKWAGVWSAEKQYSEGELVSDRGLWLATRDDIKGQRPGDGAAWRLIIRAEKGSP